MFARKESSGGKSTKQTEVPSQEPRVATDDDVLSKPAVDETTDLADTAGPASSSLSPTEQENTPLIVQEKGRSPSPRRSASPLQPRENGAGTSYRNF